MKKPKPSTSDSQTIRERLGLSQAAWADYLGMSQSHLAHAEANKRQLTLEATQKISDHIVQHHKKPTDVQKAMQEQPDKYFAADFLDNLQITLHQQTKKLAGAQATLQHMQKRHSQAVHLSQYVRLQQQRTNLTEFETLWLAAQQSQSAIDKDEYGVLPQQKLQLEIDCLKVYVAGGKQLEAKLKKDV